MTCLRQRRRLLSPLTSPSAARMRRAANWRRRLGAGCGWQVAWAGWQLYNNSTYLQRWAGPMVSHVSNRIPALGRSAAISAPRPHLATGSRRRRFALLMTAATVTACVHCPIHGRYFIPILGLGGTFIGPATLLLRRVLAPVGQVHCCMLISCTPDDDDDDQCLFDPRWARTRLYRPPHPPSRLHTQLSRIRPLLPNAQVGQRCLQLMTPLPVHTELRPAVIPDSHVAVHRRRWHSTCRRTPPRCGGHSSRCGRARRSAACGLSALVCLPVCWSDPLCHLEEVISTAILVGKCPTNTTTVA